MIVIRICYCLNEVIRISVKDWFREYGWAIAGSCVLVGITFLLMIGLAINDSGEKPEYSNNVAMAYSHIGGNTTHKLYAKCDNMSAYDINLSDPDEQKIKNSGCVFDIRERRIPRGVVN